MFSWSKDREIFMNGPLEFRWNKKEMTKDDYKNFLSIQWEKHLIKTYGIDIPGHEKFKQELQQEKNCIVM